MVVGLVVGLGKLMKLDILGITKRKEESLQKRKAYSEKASGRQSTTCVSFTGGGWGG